MPDLITEKTYKLQWIMIYNNIPKYNDYEKLHNSTIEHKRNQVSWIG